MHIQAFGPQEGSDYQDRLVHNVLKGHLEILDVAQCCISALSAKCQQSLVSSFAGLKADLSQSAPLLGPSIIMLNSPSSLR